MKLLTKTLLKALPKLGSTDGVPLEEKTAIVKLFAVGSRFTLFVFEGEVEASGDVRLFGYVLSVHGEDCDEMGYSSLNELEKVKGRFFGLGIERDTHFTPKKMAEVLARKVA